MMKKTVALILVFLLVFTGGSAVFAGEASGSPSAGGAGSSSGFPAAPLEDISTAGSAGSSLSEDEQIEELTTEAAPGSDYQGFIVKVKEDAITDEMIDEAPSDLIADRFFVVDNPEDALSFADPSDIEYIEPDYVIYALDYPDDANDTYYYSEQWDLYTTGTGIDANAAWKAGLTGDGVKVAVLDSGVNAAHEDLDQAKIAGGWTYITVNGVKQNYAGAIDDYGHGSHVTSTIAAQTDNGKGIAGMTPDVEILPVKCLDSSGKGVVSDFILAFDYALNNGADVVNCSVGSGIVNSYLSGQFLALQEEIDKLYARGIIVVAAAGNSGNSYYYFPAACKHVVGVSNTDISGARYSSSEYNASITVAAPGADIYGISNTSNDGYLSRTGTSMAAPHVAALAAVGKEIADRRGRNLNEDSFKNLLQASAVDKGTPGYDEYYGYGLINVKDYIDAAYAPAAWNSTPNAQEDALPDTNQEYQVNFILDGGTLPPGAQTTYRPSAQFIFPIPTKSGYTFAGWKGPNGTIVGGLPKYYYGDYTCTAQWTSAQITYVTYTFDWNGGKPAGPSQIDYVYNAPITGLPKPTKLGYDFVGWYTLPAGGDEVAEGSIVSSPYSKTLYAVWSPKSINYTFDVNGGDPADSYVKGYRLWAVLGELKTPERLGYTFVGWFTARSGGVAVNEYTQVEDEVPVTLYARWEGLAVDYSFFANGGNPAYNHVKEYIYGSTLGELNALVRYGYKFSGWYTAPSGGAKLTETSKVEMPMGSSNVSFAAYARWSPVDVAVTLNSNGGKNLSRNKLSLKYDGSYSGLATPSRTGYSFMGWYAGPSSGSKIVNGAKVSTANPHTLYARWQAKSYTVKLMVNGGKKLKKTSLKKTYGKPYGKLTKPTRKGYKFKGWYTSKTGGKKISASTLMKRAANHKIYAHWKRIK